ncbi:MAG: ribosome small subunit-dependent GTPase A [Treponema sp.]|nr:ribosome small subunit-dependent GTPase A [Treponema sp.]
MTGTILSGSNNTFEVETYSPEAKVSSIFLCPLKSKRLKSDKKYYNPLAPGDWVKIEVENIDSGKGLITDLIERKNSFVRWNVKGRCPQLLAANLDNIILVTTPAQPDFRPRFIDRELAQAEYQNIECVIIANKCDLEESENPDFMARLTGWEELGYKVFRVSSKTGFGINELKTYLNGKLCAFVGQSGVGKSSLINALDSSYGLKTGGLSTKYGKGCHTTTKGTLLHIQLSQEETCSVIDTPGVRRFVLHGIEASDLALYFREMQPLLGQCTFGMSCTHTNERGCKILEAVYSGVISEERYDSWKRITEEIKTGRWDD